MRDPSSTEFSVRIKITFPPFCTRGSTTRRCKTAHRIHSIQHRRIFTFSEIPKPKYNTAASIHVKGYFFLRRYFSYKWVSQLTNYDDFIEGSQFLQFWRTNHVIWTTHCEIMKQEQKSVNFLRMNRFCWKIAWLQLELNEDSKIIKLINATQMN